MPLAGEAVDELVQHAAQAREALERAQLEELVEQERRRLAAAGARAVVKNASVASNAARAPAARRRSSRERRRGADRRAGTARASSPSARRRCTAPRCGRADRAAAAAASCGRCRSRRAAPECGTATRRARASNAARQVCEESACAPPNGIDERRETRRTRARVARCVASNSTKVARSVTIAGAADRSLVTNEDGVSGVREE